MDYVLNVVKEHHIVQNVLMKWMKMKQVENLYVKNVKMEDMGKLNLEHVNFAQYKIANLVIIMIIQRLNAINVLIIITKAQMGNAKNVEIFTLLEENVLFVLIMTLIMIMILVFVMNVIRKSGYHIVKDVLIIVYIVTIIIR